MTFVFSSEATKQSAGLHGALLIESHTVALAAMLSFWGPFVTLLLSSKDNIIAL